MFKIDRHFILFCFFCLGVSVVLFWFFWWFLVAPAYAYFILVKGYTESEAMVSALTIAAAEFGSVVLVVVLYKRFKRSAQARAAARG